MQAKDSLAYKGKKGFINEAPLSSLITKRKLAFEATSTGNYSGYFAWWKIAEGKLYLANFTGRKDGVERNLKWLFPKSEGAVFANWYSGEIHLFLGKEKLRKIHGHVVVTEELVVFEIENGVVTKTRMEKYPENIETINSLVSEFLGEEIDIRKVEY